MTATFVSAEASDNPSFCLMTRRLGPTISDHSERRQGAAVIHAGRTSMLLEHVFSKAFISGVDVLCSRRYDDHQRRGVLLSTGMPIGLVENPKPNTNTRNLCASIGPPSQPPITPTLPAVPVCTLSVEWSPTVDGIAVRRARPKVRCFHDAGRR